MALGCVNIRIKLRPGTKLSSQLSDSQGIHPFHCAVPPLSVPRHRDCRHFLLLELAIEIM